MKKNLFVVMAFSWCLLWNTNFAYGEKYLYSVKVDKAPTIDGYIFEDIWKSAAPVFVRDRVSNVDIFIFSVYTDDSIFFYVTYPNLSLNSLHKPWTWDKGKETYVSSRLREDAFVMKWNMVENDVDLSNFSDDSYTADVWYWKAGRTNPSGCADDIVHTLSDNFSQNAKKITSSAGNDRFLLRSNDAGEPCYREYTPGVYEGGIVERYKPGEPSGSRGDIKAKGIWDRGFSTIEFERKLDTGHSDDVQFDPGSGKKYKFGVSINSLYGNPIDAAELNFYGMGRISEPIYLIFK